ncbi:MAG: hypothetical protein GY903_06975 [Fuerstiella sp.]|nr:hypothetical protein [Fuerstiella sp.]MCP4854219.1 hypothetical protein [Fuerstiella sp.]
MMHAADIDDTKSDPWATGFLVLLAALWLLVLIALCTPEAPNGHGVKHATIQAMDQGGDGNERHERVFVTGWMLGSVMIFLFTGMLAWGTVRQPFHVLGSEQCQTSGSVGRLRWFLIGGLLFEAVFGMLCYSYWNSLADPRGDFSGPFPPGVSWMLFGVWLFPAFFIVLYVACFHSWILPPENARRFAELVAECSSPDTSDTGDA